MSDLIDRQATIKNNDFDQRQSHRPASSIPTDFSKIKVGNQTLEDAVVNLGSFRKINPRLGDKHNVLRALYNNNCKEAREISNFFYRVSGIYSRLCRYAAYLYKYDWYITPFIRSEKMTNEAIIDAFQETLQDLDKFQIKRWCGEVALKVILNGCYYGYVIKNGKDTTVQELPPNYCRSRYSSQGMRPAVEFNMKFFDDTFPDTVYRLKILNMFPAEFKKAYMLYKQDRLPKDFAGDTSGWYLLDTDCAVKFNLNGSDMPLFTSVIPAIIDLDEAQGLDRKKMQQQLIRLIIQKMPLDDNGDLIFDPDEIQDFHANAVKMVGEAIGVSVLTTVADVDVEDLSDNSTTTTTDELEKMERSVYNASGIAQNMFNSDGNLALEKSIANDESMMLNLLSQFEAFINQVLLADANKRPKKIFFKAEMLPTSIYNYQDLAKLYKEQTSMGYSKMLPQIALGQSQSTILATAVFENDILDLVNLFVPPITSSTMNADALKQEEGEGESGRQEKDDDEKSEKTIANIESAS